MNSKTYKTNIDSVKPTISEFNTAIYGNDYGLYNEPESLKVNFKIVKADTTIDQAQRDLAFKNVATNVIEAILHFYPILEYFDITELNQDPK